MRNFFAKAAAFLAFVCAVVMPQAAFADGTNWIDLHNLTNGVISQVHFKETWSTEWGDNAIHNGYVGQGQTLRIFVTSQSCVIDMHTHFTNGADHILRLNVCTASHVDDQGSGMIVAF